MILDEQGIVELFNIKTPFRKMRSRTFPFYFLLVMFLINYVLGISFVLPTHFEEFMTMGIIFLILGFIVAVLFVIACNK